MRAPESSRARSRSSRRIDPERAVLHAHAGDPHSILQRPQLLQTLAPFQRAWRQRDVAVERGAAIGVNPDMVPARPEPPRDRLAGEIQRRRDPLALFEGAGGFDERNRRGLDFIADRHDQGADIDVRIGQRGHDQAQTLGVQRREIALQVDHHVVLSIRVQFGQCRVYAI